VTIQSPNVIIQGDLEVRGKIVNAHLEWIVSSFYVK
jgi:hypothetical protein